MVTDLTNTTWEVSSGWTATAGEVGYKSVNGTVTTSERTAEMTAMMVGMNAEYDNVANNINFSVNGSPPWFEISNTVGFTVTFTGGEDTTNTDLISWLEANGTLQGGETPTPKLYIGNKAVTSMSIGNKAILKMYVGNSLIYEKASGEESVSITLDHQSEGLQAVSYYYVYVKFGTQPTSNNDFDYKFDPTSNGGYVYDSTMTRVITPFTTNVKPIAYIWSTMSTGWASYSLNGGAKQMITTAFDFGYENAVELQLQNGDTLTVYTAVPD